MQNLFGQLVGTWGLVSYTLKDDSGEIHFPFGRDATGYLMYNRDGYMSAQLMAQKRPNFSSGDLHRGSTEEMAAAAGGYLAYTGPFYVDEDTREVTHLMAVSLLPNWIGQTQTRILKVTEDRLVMSSQARLTHGRVGEPRVEWRRAQPNFPES